MSRHPSTAIAGSASISARLGSHVVATMRRCAICLAAKVVACHTVELRRSPMYRLLSMEACVGAHNLTSI